ncbi:uncharacterized protein LOC135205424 isoform X2 [Macrobrachium nipponense]|uniref:uncharacterized protein LOC135205424 isoform X2 n=1 Tax=Macrobrachium nipponense TaxID=159736 RepID=UPI0030C824E9
MVGLSLKMLVIHNKSLLVLLLIWVTVLVTVKHIMAEQSPKDGVHFQGHCKRTQDGREYSSNLELHKTNGILEPCMYWEDISSGNKTANTSQHGNTETNSTSQHDITEANSTSKASPLHLCRKPRGTDMNSTSNANLQNFCRNPGDFDTPYCFSLNPNATGKQPCPIPFCPELYHYRTSSRGLEYQGTRDFREERKCLDVCQVDDTFGLSCPTQLQDRIIYKSRIPCDIPMQKEIPVFEEIYRRGTVFIPITTWYVPASPHNISYSGSGQLMLYLPESSEFRSTLSVVFQIRLADPGDVDSFHLDINFLPSDTFEDYYNVSFSSNGVEIQRILYQSKTVVSDEKIKEESEEDEGDLEEQQGKLKKGIAIGKDIKDKIKKMQDTEKRNGTTKIFKKTESSGKYAKLPFMKLRHDWLVFEIRFLGTRISLYFEGESKPILELMLPFERLGISQYKFNDRYVFQRYMAPRYVNFHSIRGTSMVAIKKVNKNFYTCIEGKIKYPSPDDHVLLHPLAAMPLQYSKDDNPLDEKVRNRSRKICLRLTNTPASIIFFSAPIFSSSNINSIKKVLTLLLEVQREAIMAKQCILISDIDFRNAEVSCLSNLQFVSEIKLQKIIPIGAVVSLCIENYLKDGHSIVKINGSIGESSILNETILKGAFLRYWTLLKKRPDEQVTKISQLGPLEFNTFHDLCTKQKYTSPLVAACVVHNYDFMEVDKKHTQHIGGISWSNTGKPCFPWPYFRSHLVMTATGENIPEGNSCMFLPNSTEMDTESTSQRVDFWCYVSLNGSKELCDIPNCGEIFAGMNCLATYEEKLQSPSSEDVCSEIVDPHFVLDLSIPFIRTVGTRTQIFNADRGIVVYLRSISASMEAPVCIYLYSDTDDFPLAEFRITKSSLSMGYLWLAWNDIKVSTDRLSYYLNSWSYNAYTISQTPAGWNLFHGDEFQPSITFNTSLQLTEIQLSGCFRRERVQHTGEFVVVHIEPVLYTSEMQEILGLHYFPGVDLRQHLSRYYLIEKKTSPHIYVKLSLMLLQTKEAVSFWIFLFKELPTPSTAPLARIHITENSMTVYYGGLTSRKHKKNTAPKFKSFTEFFKLEVKVRLLHRSYRLFATYKKIEIQMSVTDLPSFYSMQVSKGGMKIVQLKTW